MNKKILLLTYLLNNIIIAIQKEPSITPYHHDPILCTKIQKPIDELENQGHTE